MLAGAPDGVLRNVDELVDPMTSAFRVAACASWLLAAGGAGAWAEERRLPERFSTEAVRERYGEVERQRIDVDGKALVLERNSNFLCGPQKTAILGTLTASETPEREPSVEHARILWARFKGKSDVLRMQTASHETRPHEVRLLLGDTDLTGNPTYSSALMGFHQRPCQDDGWKPVDGVEVAVAERGSVRITEYRKGEAAPPRAQPLSDLSCATTEVVGHTAKSAECRIPPWGRAALSLE